MWIILIKKKRYQSLIDDLRVANATALRYLSERDTLHDYALDIDDLLAQTRIDRDTWRASAQMWEEQADALDAERKALQADLAAARQREAEYAVKRSAKSKKVEQGL